MDNGVPEKKIPINNLEQASTYRTIVKLFAMYMIVKCTYTCGAIKLVNDNCNE